MPVGVLAAFGGIGRAVPAARYFTRALTSPVVFTGERPHSGSTMSRNGASRASHVILATLAGMVGWNAAAPAQERLWKQVGSRNLFPSFGMRVRSGGDIDGDGIWDVIVGDSDFPDAQGNSIGAAWIFSGVDGSLVYRLSLKSGVSERFGTGVAIGPDGDGHAEFFVTAPGATPAGAAYLVDVNGAPTPAPIAIGSCDGTGRFILSGTVPSGLRGVYVDMPSIGVDPGGRFVGSYFEQIYFK